MTKKTHSAAHSRRKTATVEQMAAMEFEAWRHAPDEWTPPSNSEWALDAAAVLPPVRVAWLTMYKTKPEVEDVIAKLGDDGCETMLGGIAHARKFFEGFAKILDAAEIRLICAAASHYARRGSPGEA